ncbi:uncharacterized protein LOC143024855 [Oratosquilla oratoria]|uniref:uncharacterized protein LOC143024855 n=1 Tax=Oratosquilla oratoria TaxID=337810 RepID=UPI003F7652C1
MSSSRGNCLPGTTAEMERLRRQGGDEEVNPSTCCQECKTILSIFIRLVILRLLSLALYVMDILTDVGAAYGDYKAGDYVIAIITLGLVFAPGVLLGCYLFCLTLLKIPIQPLKSLLKAPLFLIASPFMFLWPIGRKLVQTYHGFLAIFPSLREKHLDILKNNKSRAYLLVFLEAFVESAPQILLRLYKITLMKKDRPFEPVSLVEGVQLAFSLLSLSTTLLSTHQKNVTTTMIVAGDLDDKEKFSLPFRVKVLAFFWWWFFLAARFEAMALFAGTFGPWVFLVVGVHVFFIFFLQTVGSAEKVLRKVFIYLFSAFIFVFAYLQFNVKSRVTAAPWFSYVIFSVLVFVEDTAMLIGWFLTQNALYPAVEDHMYREQLLFVHFGAFALALIFMILTFCCTPQAPTSQPPALPPSSLEPLSETSVSAAFEIGCHSPPPAVTLQSDIGFDEVDLEEITRNLEELEKMLTDK